MADIIHKGPGEGGKQWVEKDISENVGFLSNKGKVYSSHRNWTKTVITSVIGAALAEAQADPAPDSLVQPQSEPLSPPDRLLKSPSAEVKPVKPAPPSAAAKLRLVKPTPPSTVAKLPTAKPKSTAAASKPAASAKPSAAKAKSAAVDSKPAASAEPSAAKSKSTAAASKPAAGAEPAAVVSQPATALELATVAEPSAATLTSHPAPLLPKVAVTLPVVSSLDTVEEASLGTITVEQPLALDFDLNPLTEELDWGFHDSPVAPEASAKVPEFLVAPSPLASPAAGATTAATCLWPVTVLSAGAAAATVAAHVLAGSSTVHAPRVSYPESHRVQETLVQSDSAPTADGCSLVLGKERCWDLEGFLGR